MLFSASFFTLDPGCPDLSGFPLWLWRPFCTLNAKIHRYLTLTNFRAITHDSKTAYLDEISGFLPYKLFQVPKFKL